MAETHEDADDDGSALDELMNNKKPQWLDNPRGNQRQKKTQACALLWTNKTRARAVRESNKSKLRLANCTRNQRL